MVGWLVYSAARLERNREYARLYEHWCEKRGIQLDVVLAEDVAIGYGLDGPWFVRDGRVTNAPKFAIFRCEDTDFRRALEAAGTLVNNSSRIGDIANDKLRTYELARNLGTPFLPVEVVCANGNVHMEPPFVLKPRCGHGGNDVHMVRTAEELHRIATRGVALDNTWLAQRVSPVLGKDLRVYVLGGRVLVAMLRTATNETFRSNYCLGGTAQPYDLDNAQLEMVKKFARTLGPGYYGIDFLVGEEDGLLFNEVEDVVGSRMLFDHTDIDVVDEHMTWIIASYERGIADCRMV